MSKLPIDGVIAAKRIVSAAKAELGGALAQSIPSDDQIIMNRVRVAQELLTAVNDLLSDIARENGAPRHA